MERTFITHRVREDLGMSQVWTLTTLDPGGLDRPEKTVVPGVWETHPKLKNYRGRGVYEQDIVCGGNVRFWFGGVGFRAKVRLDGQLIAGHYDAYTGFEALALGIKEGLHRLSVEADNRFGEDSALQFPNDYYAYGGISRPVTAQRLGDAYIVRCCAAPERAGDGWQTRAEMTVRNVSALPVNAVLSLSLAGACQEREISLRPGETGTFAFSLFCGQAESWSPEDPKLYALEALLSQDGKPVDDWIDRIGFREITVSGSQILLNGKPLRLRGFNRHEEYASFGQSVPLKAMLQDIQLMRDMGANCVRTCHYPNDPRFLDLCDEMGLLVWEESHARGLSEEQMKHPLFMEQLRRSTEEMVLQHMNHPSVFIWGCLNECADDTEYGAKCYEDIFALLRRLDPSRPVTAALVDRPGGRVYGSMDVVSVNLYPQWYLEQTSAQVLDRKLREIAANGGAGKPVIVSEIGAGAIYGFHDPLGEAKWSEERQCAILEQQITAVMDCPDVCGLFLWQLADVRVSEEWAMRRPRTFNNKGVVDEYRRPKLAYRTVKALFERMARKAE